MLHRPRDLLMRQRTMLLNAVLAHLAEFGIIMAQGSAKVLDFVARSRNGETLALPDMVRSTLLGMAAQLDSLAVGIRSLERQIIVWHRSSAASQRLETIPGVGLITATALAANVPDPSVFRSGRQFAAYLGLVPRQNSSGGKERLGSISKMSNGHPRRLLVVGATSVIRHAGDHLNPGEVFSHRRSTRSMPGSSGYAACPVETGSTSGTWYADFIKASSHQHRTQRPDT